MLNCFLKLKTVFNFNLGPEAQWTEHLQLIRWCCELHHCVPDHVWTSVPAVCSCRHRIKVLFPSDLFLQKVFELHELLNSECWCNISKFILKLFQSSRFYSTPNKDAPLKKTRLSRTLSDTPSSESEPSDPSASQSPQKVSTFIPRLSSSDNSVFSPIPSQSTANPLHPASPSLEPRLSNGKKNSHEAEEEALDESYYHSFHSNGDEGSRIHDEGDVSALEENSSHLNGADGDAACGTVFDLRGTECGNEESYGDESRGHGSGNTEGYKAETGDLPPLSGVSDNTDEAPLVPMTLYLHRVKGLVLALLVEPLFLSDTASMEEVVRNNPSSHYYVECLWAQSSISVLLTNSTKKKLNDAVYIKLNLKNSVRKSVKQTSNMILSQFSQFISTWVPCNANIWFPQTISSAFLVYT